MDTPDAAPQFDVTENVDVGRFELRRNDELVGYADYLVQDGVIVVPHVETIAEHRGNGYAARLMDGLLATIAADGRRIVPLCSFARGHVRDNPQHHHLLA
ncbi:MAG: GNAT family N-acetyltransferase [Acidimicrobiales bacterium]